MHALEEKNALTQELEKMRKLAEDLQSEKTEIMKELGKARLEIDNVKRQMLQQEIAFNIQQTDALTRSLSPNAVDPGTFSRSASHSSFDTHSLPRRKRTPLDDDVSKVRTKIIIKIRTIKVDVFFSSLGSLIGVEFRKVFFNLEHLQTNLDFALSIDWFYN